MNVVTEKVDAKKEQTSMKKVRESVRNTTP